MRDRKHPLVDIFAINVLNYDESEKKYTADKPSLTTKEMWVPQKEEFWTEKVDQIRDRYGEWVAFYFGMKIVSSLHFVSFVCLLCFWVCVCVFWLAFCFVL